MSIRTPAQQYRREVAIATGSFSLFAAGLTMAIVGGLTASPILFGLGLGICIVLTVIGLCVREHNIAS